MVSFATKAGPNVREDVKRSSGGGKFLRTVRDGKDCRVRFLQDPEEWFKYREHFGQATKFFPCTQDDSCPGCSSDDEKMKKTSRRYIANVVIVAEKDAKDEGQVVLLKIPVDLANRLINKADRNQGTLLTRDYTLIRTGNGLDTTYDAEAEDRSKVNTEAFPRLDPEPYLAEMFDSAWGTAKLETITDKADLKLVRNEEQSLLTPQDELPKAQEEDKPPF